MKVWTDKFGKTHKHLMYIGSHRPKHFDENNKPLKCCRERRKDGAKIFTACMYSIMLKDIYDYKN